MNDIPPDVKAGIAVAKDVDKLNAYMRKFLLQNRLNSCFSPADVQQILKVCDVFWMHSGDPAKPHAELTSGKRSNGFVDVLQALCNPLVCAALASDLAIRLSDSLPRDRRVWVVGSDHAGASFSKDVALKLAMLRFSVKHEFTEKGPEVELEGGMKEKTQIWKRHKIAPDDLVLQIEELMTTAATFKAVRKGLQQAHSYPLQFAKVAGVLVHRSKVKEFEESLILHSLHLDIDAWAPEDCPLCKQGSKRLKPKVVEHWAELTGKQ